MRGGAICHSCSAPRFAAIALAIIGSIGQSHATEAGLAQMELVENSVFGPEASSVAATGFSAAEGGEIQNITFDLANTDPLGVSRFAPTPQQGPPTLGRELIN